MNVPPKPYFTQALEALKRGDRRAAAALLAKELQFGNTAQKNLPSVAQLATNIGEVELAIEGARIEEISAFTVAPSRMPLRLRRRTRRVRPTLAVAVPRAGCPHHPAS